MSGPKVFPIRFVLNEVPSLLTRLNISQLCKDIKYVQSARVCGTKGFSMDEQDGFLLLNRVDHYTLPIQSSFFQKKNHFFSADNRDTESAL